jgi:hypothetical protein
MKDFLGNDLEINDYVVYVLPAYRMLAIGQISSFTQKNIRLNTRVSKTELPDMVNDTFLQAPNQVVKIGQEQLKNYI